MQYVYKLFLADTPHRMKIATNCSQAIELCSFEEFDLVLLDVVCFASISLVYV